MMNVLRWTARGAGTLLLAAILMLVVSPALPVPAEAAQATPVASPVAADAVAFAGLVVQPGPVTVAELQQLPTETVEVSYETSNGPEPHAFTGIRLYGVLEAVGPLVGPDERNPWLSRSVVVTANDGYRVLLSGGELDSDFGDAPLLLAWEQDGQPLPADRGPVRLVAPGDLRGGRYVYGVVRIEVLGLDGVPAGA